MNRVFLAAAIGYVILLVASCSQPGEGNTADEKGSGRPPVAVEVSQAALTELARAVEVVGSLSPKFSADVKSEYTGIVAEVYVNEWVRVKKGMPLAKIDTREPAAAVEMARAGLLQAQVAETRAHRELERAIKLKEVGLVTEQALDDARTAREAAAAGTAAAQAQLQAAETRLAKAVIRAPMDGVISYRGVNVGDLVENMGAPKPMFRIVNNHILDLTVTVPSGKMGMVHVGQTLVFSTDAIPGKMFTGEIMFINPVVSEADRSVKLIAEVRNESEELRAGLFVNGRILTGTRTNILQVPRTALLNWDVVGNRAEVFVVHGNVVERRTVQTGTAAGNSVEVTSGLTAGDLVVTRGAFTLRDGDRVTVVKGGDETQAAPSQDTS